MIDNLVDQLDDFVTNPANATFANAADVATASSTLKGAIKDWSQLSKSERIENMIEKASFKKIPFNQAIKDQFSLIAQDPAKLRRFSETEREAIKAIAHGENQSKVLILLSQLAPSLNVRDIARTGASVLTGVAGYHTGSVPLMLTAAGMSAAGLGARGVRNVMARHDANALAAAMRTGSVQPPSFYPVTQTPTRAAPQAIMQAQQPENYYQ